MATTLTARALVRLSATDPAEDLRGFLQGLVTQDVAKVAPGAPQYAALLSAQGKCLFDFLIWADGEDLLLDCEADAADDLVKRLSLYRLRRKIAIAREEALAVHWEFAQEEKRPSPSSVQADSGTTTDDLGGAEPVEPRSSPGNPANDPRLTALGRRWLAPSAQGSADAQWLAHRLALGIAEGAAELGDVLWLECNAIELNGVTFDKGCYVGQENTARMNWRQKINRRIVIVPLALADEKRQRIAYPDHGVSVEHRRVEDMADLPLPDWQKAAIAAPA